VFRQVATQPEKGILEALGQEVMPKRVLDARGCMDPLEKCMWILEQKFNCQRLGYLNMDQFKTAAMVVEKMSHIHLPLLISVVGVKSVYTHVVVVWRGTIIDFETLAPYPLSVSSVETICGSKNAFHSLRCGFIIRPSKRLKASIGDFTDWGEKELKGIKSHLFSNCK